jgi:hypothetical protein
LAALDSSRPVAAPVPAVGSSRTTTAASPPTPLKTDLPDAARNLDAIVTRFDSGPAKARTKVGCVARLPET